MNLWKQTQGKEIGVGGWKCHCCTPFGKRKKRHRDKMELVGRTRTRIKRITKKEFDEIKKY